MQAISVIQRGSDEIARLLKTQRMPTRSYTSSCNTAKEIIERRCFVLMNQFTTQLKEHQRMIQMQEAKKEKLMHGGLNKAKTTVNGSS